MTKIASARPPPAAAGRRSRLVAPPVGSERWFGFDAVRDLAGLPPEILPGGRAGVAVREDDGRWLFYAGIADRRRIREPSTDRSSAVRVFLAHDAVEFGHRPAGDRKIRVFAGNPNARGFDEQIFRRSRCGERLAEPIGRLPGLRARFVPGVGTTTARQPSPSCDGGR